MVQCDPQPADPTYASEWAVLAETAEIERCIGYNAD